MSHKPTSNHLKGRFPMHIKITPSTSADAVVSEGKAKASGKDYKFYKCPAKVITENDDDEETTKCTLTFNDLKDIPAPGLYELNMDKATYVDRFGGIAVRIDRTTLVAMG